MAIGTVTSVGVIGTMFLNPLQGAVVRYASRLASGKCNVELRRLLLVKVSSSVSGMVVALQITSMVARRGKTFFPILRTVLLISRGS